MNIEQLGLPHSIYDRLIKGDIKTVEQLAGLKQGEITEFGFTEAELKEILNRLQEIRRELELLDAVKKIGPVADDFIQKLRDGAYG